MPSANGISLGQNVLLSSSNRIFGSKPILTKDTLKTHLPAMFSLSIYLTSHDARGFLAGVSTWTRKCPSGQTIR
jgi:hypothetical protein